MSERTSTAATAPLFQAWTELRRESAAANGVAVARTLGVTEIEILAARTAEGDAIALRPDPARLLAEVPGLGPVSAVTRSSAAELACAGTYGPPDIGEHTGIVLGENIDLRIFPSGWRFAYAVREKGGPCEVAQPSLLIGDATGAATHEIRLLPESNVAAFEALVRTLALHRDDIEPRIELTAPQPPLLDTQVDRDAYCAAFATMTDTHDFFLLLRRFGLAREQGLRLAPAEFARPLSPAAHRALFSLAAADKIPLMLFVASEGCVQIASGPIPHPTFARRRCSLEGARVRLELDETSVARAWAVRKPTSNGVVTSLELYDASGRLVLQVFGERHQGSAERLDWARAIADLTSEA